MVDNRVDYYHSNELYKCYKELSENDPIIIIAKESEKEISQVFLLIDRISDDFDTNEKSAIVGIGGGVVLNIATFIASLIGRGIRLCLVPTTPMSISDVAIGSKSGCNSHNQKHYIGTYYDPEFIYINKRVINTLSDGFIRRDIVESIKQFMLLDYDRLIKAKEILESKIINNDELYDEIIYPSIIQKIELINNDPYEANLGRVLQFGHLVAHSLEIASGFKLHHSKAVAIGILADLKMLKKMHDKIDLNLYHEILSLMGVRLEDIYIKKELFIRAMRLSKVVNEKGYYGIINLKDYSVIDDDELYVMCPVNDMIEMVLSGLKSF